MKPEHIRQTILDRLELLTESVNLNLREKFRPSAGYSQINPDSQRNYTQQYIITLAESIGSGVEMGFLHFLEWQASMLIFHGTPLAGMMAVMDEIQNVLTSLLPKATHESIFRLTETGKHHIQNTPHLTTSAIQADGPYAGIANEYLDALLKSDKKAAHQIIMDALDNSVNVEDVYLSIFQPALVEVGRLWQMNAISVAQEHYATAVTQMIMSTLFPRFLNTPRKGKVLVAASVGSELHEIGIRMVADIFEINGWDTYFLGANTPTSSILQTIVERNADCLAISVTISRHIPTARDLITQIRLSPARHTRVLVGGYVFNHFPDLWRHVGADGSAPDALSALQLVQQLTTE